MEEPARRPEPEREREPRLREAPKAPMEAPMSGLAVAALILGIIGVVFFWVPIFGVICSLLAIIFGGAGLYQTQRGDRRGGSAAVAGLVLGIIGVIPLTALLRLIF